MTTIEYRIWVGNKCAKPGCVSENYRVETHHILKQRMKGPNKAWNYVALCVKCHREHENDLDSFNLFFWKSSQEIKLHGFFLDEYDPASEIKAKKSLGKSIFAIKPRELPAVDKCETFIPIKSTPTETPDLYKYTPYKTPKPITGKIVSFSKIPKRRKAISTQREFKIDFEKVTKWLEAADKEALVSFRDVKDKPNSFRYGL